jgi:hypothetical protein
MRLSKVMSKVMARRRVEYSIAKGKCSIQYTLYCQRQVRWANFWAPHFVGGHGSASAAPLPSLFTATFRPSRPLLLQKPLDFPHVPVEIRVGTGS